jgi:hypothetical protein
MTELCFYACGRYSRAIEVTRGEGRCFECKSHTGVLEFDSSDGEYTTMKFCASCLQDFFDGKISKSNWGNDLSDYCADNL